MHIMTELQQLLYTQHKKINHPFLEDCPVERGVPRPNCIFPKRYYKTESNTIRKHEVGGYTLIRKERTIDAHTLNFYNRLG